MRHHYLDRIEIDSRPYENMPEARALKRTAV